MRVPFLAVAFLVVPVMALGLSPSTKTQGPDGEAKGPGLEWRSLAGEVRFQAVDEAPGEKVVSLPGVWMRPVGLAPLQALEGEDLPWLGFLEGDRLQAKVLGGDAEALDVEGAGNSRLRIPIDHLVSLVFPSRRSDTGLIEAAKSGDRLYRRSGSAVDRVDGVLLSFSEQGVAMETSLGERVFPWGEVVALFVEPLGEVASVTKDGHLTLLDLTCGSRLRGTLKSIDSAAVTLTRSGGAEWRIPHPWIRELTRFDGSFTHLSMLEPVQDGPVRSPFDPPGSEPLGMVWPYRVDRGVGGGLLRAGGRIWSHGFGVHAPSTLRWDLTGQYCSLRLSAGLDGTAQRASKSGSVSFEVRVDGKSVWSSGLRRGGQPLVTPDPIDLTGAKSLELVVTDGGDGPVLDRAAWLAPILIRCP